AARASPVPGDTMPRCAGAPPSGTAEAATRATREGSRGAMGSGCYSATGAESGATTHGFRSRAARRARVHQVLPPRRAVVCAHRWGERTMIRRHLLLLLVALLVGVPAACGDDGGSSGDGEAAEELAEEQAADEGADDEAAGGGRGGRRRGRRARRRAGRRPRVHRRGERAVLRRGAGPGLRG